MENKRAPTSVDQMIGAKIASIREAQSMSQGELGKACGVSFQQIQKYEKGLNRLSCGRLLDVAQAQGVTVGSYFEGLELMRRESTSSSEAVRWGARWLMTPQALELGVDLARLSDTDRGFAIWMVRKIASHLKTKGPADVDA